MYGDIAAAFATIKSIGEVLTAMLEIKTVDGARAKAVEMNMLLFDLQARLSGLRSEHEELLSKHDSLKEKMTAIRNWKRESKADTLHELAPGVYSRSREMTVDGTKKRVELCAKCHENERASILQFKGEGSDSVYFCPQCDLKLIANN